MNNVSNKERTCIEKSHEARLAAAKARLAELEKNGIPFDSAFSGMIGRIEWHEGIVGKLLQIALLPLELVFVLVAIVMTPIAYIKHLCKIRQKKKEIEKEILVLEAEQLSDQVPDVKDVESLWRIHGLDERKYSLTERASLLESWVGVLYGKDVSDKLRLKFRAGVIARRNLRANQCCYEDMDAPHFRFASPVDTLVRQVSEELPAYE